MRQMVSSRTAVRTLQKHVVWPSSIKACAYLRQMVVRSALAVHTLAEACSLVVVCGFASVPVEEISKKNFTGRPRGGRTEYLETELNHISQNKIKSRQTLFRIKIKLYVVLLSFSQDQCRAGWDLWDMRAETCCDCTVYRGE